MTEHSIYIVLGRTGSIEWHVCWRHTLDEAIAMVNILTDAVNLYEQLGWPSRGESLDHVKCTDAKNELLKLDPQAALGRGVHYWIIKISDDSSVVTKAFTVYKNICMVDTHKLRY